MNEELLKRIAETEQSYYENQARFPIEELAKYYAQYVAWSLDGSMILAAGATSEELDDHIATQKIDPTTIVYGYVDEPDVAYAGGYEIRMLDSRPK